MGPEHFSNSAPEKFLAAVVECSDDAIITKSLDSVILSWNGSAQRMFGYLSEEAVGQPITLIIPSERHAEELDIIGRLRQGMRVQHFETQRLRKDGSLLSVSLTASPVRDAEGKIVAVSKTLRDITERKRLEAQLSQTQRLEIVGRLAGGIAHDFNNLLTPILGYSEMLREELAAVPAQQEMVQEIERAAARGADLTRQLLAFSRRQVLQPRVVDLNVQVAEMAKLLQRVLGEDVSLELNLAPDAGNVKVDPGQIEQVVMNLAVNARDAMPRGGRFLLESKRVTLDHSYVASHEDVLPGDYVMLAASDNGVGMDKETLDHLFEPFFSTKDRSQGTGLGLSTVHGIVRQSGGHVWVYSELGRGATFKLYFPASGEALSPSTSKPPVAVAIQATQTLMVVEDDAALRHMVVEGLRQLGYTILEAARGEEALALAKTHPGSIDLLLTDVVMPGLSGRELAKQLAASRPHTKVLYMSGYTENSIVHHGVLDEGMQLIEKPFTLSALAAKLSEILSRL